MNSIQKTPDTQKTEKEMQRNRNETVKTNMLSMLEKTNHCINVRKKNYNKKEV